MNSNYGKPNAKSSAFDFDLGLGSSKQSKSLNDQKNPNPSSYTSYTSSSSYSSASASQQPKSAWQSNKPSWTHQPALLSKAAAPAGPGFSNAPASMVGDIFGKSWSSDPVSVSGIGIVDKNPNLFGDLFTSALGQGGKSSSGNVQLKKAAPLASKQMGSSGNNHSQSAYSMGNLSDSLPKTSASSVGGGAWGTSKSFGSSSGGFTNVNIGVNNNANVKSMDSGGVGVGGGMSSNRDPFVSLVDFSSKQSGGSMNSASKATNKANSGGGDDDLFGDFQDAPKPSAATFSSSSTNDPFTGFGSSSKSKTDNFGMPANDFGAPNQPPVQNDPLDMLFSSSGSAGAGATAAGVGVPQFSGADDWDTEFGGGNDGGGSTTELEGLPPPPTGVTASSAKNKGIDNQRSGQYADAIKWLSWAVVLIEKTGDKASAPEVLTSRASCYKEVGEYKKAVADCSKVLDTDKANVSVLVQRALLYESMEKYKLGAEDLRTVLKIDPSNRIARSTIHRLTKMID